ncbi:IS256 family transposase [Streptomyces chartreusis]|uniref:IS256 family transposase n=1 Tax=Streptomyces chartreusis TaxID=1969 RepID=UPI00380BC57F
MPSAGPSPERTASCNGYRQREWDTRVGTIDLAVPRIRSGSYFPDWLLERRQRSEQALVSVVATCYLLGVSTRRVEKLAEALGVTRLSKSQVSEMSKALDGRVAEFRDRPLDAGPYTFVWLDALTQKVREGGRVVNVHCLVAVGVNVEGRREVLGIEVASAEDGAGWLAFLRSLTARGLTGVELIVSDAHVGLIDAIGCAMPGASWQRCRTTTPAIFCRRCPRLPSPGSPPCCGPCSSSPTRTRSAGRWPSSSQGLDEKFPTAAEHLDTAREDLRAFTAFPREVWKQTWSNNPQERLNKEIRRRTDVVGIFPDLTSIVHLICAVLAEQTDEWTEQRRYIGPEILGRCHLRLLASTNRHDQHRPRTRGPHGIA